MSYVYFCYAKTFGSTYAEHNIELIHRKLESSDIKRKNMTFIGLLLGKAFPFQNGFKVHVYTRIL